MKCASYYFDWKCFGIFQCIYFISQLALHSVPYFSMPTFCENCYKWSLLKLCYFVLKQNISTGKSVMTVFASDNDDVSTPNGTFNFRLISVTPKTDNVEFYMTQNHNTGGIYFKGCLDYEVNISKCTVYSVLFHHANICCPSNMEWLLVLQITCMKFF